jgi:hypothetical protein
MVRLVTGAPEMYIGIGTVVAIILIIVVLKAVGVF